MFLLVGTFLFQVPVQAQDDLYYDPATDASARPQQAEQPAEGRYNNQPSKVTRRYQDNNTYADENDYGYEYSSRIRRFHQPAPVTDFYDPFYVDQYHYDPYYLPGASIYTYGYNDYWTWRRWQRYNSWNRPSFGFYDYGWGGCGVSFSPWGWGGGYYSPWSSPFVYNSYYYDPYWTWNGYNPYYGYGGYGGYGYGGYGNGSYYHTSDGGNNGYKPQTYTGPRRGGTTVNPGYARLTSGSGNGGRLTTANSTTPSIELRPHNNGGRNAGTTASGQSTGYAPGNRVSREVPATTNGTRSNLPAVSSDRSRYNTNSGHQTDAAPARSSGTDRARYAEPARSNRSEETRPARRADSAPSRSGGEYRPSHNSGSFQSAPRSSGGSGGGSSHSSGGSSSSHSSSSGHSGGGRH